MKWNCGVGVVFNQVKGKRRNGRCGGGFLPSERKKKWKCGSGFLPSEEEEEEVVM